jgi:L-ascorbate metabolism protein UlaG (beta-lactamase superfamily)/quercetin dioxygenase-like cupin family protein
MRNVAVVLVITAAAATSLRAADRVPASGGDILITPLIHASVQLEHAGKVIHVDPWTRGELSRAKPADLILVTDTDDGAHHLDPAAIQKLRKPGAPVVIPASGTTKVPDGVVLANGQSRSLAGIMVESIAAYDIKPGDPYHPKGEANGYVVTIGGKRIYFAGVTECVPEIKALKNVDVAFMPMNLPQERMLPAAAADCLKILKPQIVYPYHYDNARLRPGAPPETSPLGFDDLKKALTGTGIEVRGGNWYPAAPAPSAQAATAPPRAAAPAAQAAAPAAQAGEADPGVRPTRLIDRDEVRVSRVELQPGATRRVHTHDDVEFHLWVPLTGTFQLSVGSDAPAPAAPGQAFFFKRGTPHGFRNVGTAAGAVLEIFVKDSKKVDVAQIIGGLGVPLRD